MAYDAIVVGLGGMGSAAAFHLARRGLGVLGLERFGAAHEMGSSHGRSRIIRQAYFEGPEYVPLLLRAYELWEELERESGRELLALTGALMVGGPEGELVAGSLRSAREHGLPHELLEARQVRERFPALRPSAGEVALYEERAGFLRPEECVRAHLELASGRGAELRFGEPAISWRACGERVEVRTAAARYEAGRLVISAGPWAPQLLAELGLPLRVERRVMFWLGPAEDPGRLPVLLWEPEDGELFYAVPDGWRGGVKAAFHHAGGAPCTPETLQREVREEEASSLRERLARHAPPLAGRLLDARACMYTLTPDGHFVISAHPRHPRVAIACGFSGHGFKFASVVGEILADLTAGGSTRHPIGLFSPERLTEPAR
ncbi:Sarcosine oxidase [Rubrobacter xylanophilus DSM 9941]|uniref:Sarcosine oxidase n=1 Tax=Rubrobacter xylanophilus (strain DSM 9941 / JCM 11954 / NBRC 16129 / PRD-1) TaxID=266117 RepID=Q1ARZ2_RUBXD|nr:N-methyl-L-tryptophan oxidase [Rubrobacter xylanophilus]ABG05836.1 Sarcosine oxidase [Rubrobacter xylanophilus DSM 9941]